MAKEKETKSKSASRLAEISNVISKIASGDFSARAELSPENDEVDAIATSLNMLAEELAEGFTEKRYIERRVEALLDTLQKAAAGNLKAPSPIEGKDDIFDALAVGINMMIEEIRKDIQEINQGKLYIENIISSLVDMLILVDPQAKIKTVNRETCDLLGYKEDELIGKSIATIFAEEEEEEEEEEESIFKGTRLKKFIEDERIGNYEMTFQTKEGENISVSFSGSVMRDEKNEIMGIVGIARDIREMKRLMQREKEAKEEAAATIEGMAEAVAIINLDGTIRQVNSEFERGSGWKKEEIMGKTPVELGTMSKKEGQKIEKEVIPKLMKKGSVRNIETTAIRKDGTKFPALMSWTLMKDAEGKPTSIITVERDITEIKQVQDEIQALHQKRDAEQKETMEKIISAQELATKKIATDLHDELAQTATASHYRLGAYINDHKDLDKDSLKDLREIDSLLTESIDEVRRIIDGIRPTVLDEVGLVSAIKKYTEKVKKESGLQTNVSMRATSFILPSHMETAIYRIATEAIFNAQKHANAKKIEVDLKRKDSELILEVDDDGMGFDIEEIDKSEDNWGIVGMRERAEILGGSLDIKSSPGKGTRVILIVPISER